MVRQLQIEQLRAGGMLDSVGAIPALVEQNGWLFMADQVRGLRVFDLDPVSIRLTGNRVVVLDQDGKALKPSIDYTIQATGENFGSVTVDIYRVEKDAAGQVTGESLYRSYPTGRKKSGSAAISAETFPLDQTFYARVIVNKGITGKQTRSVKIPFIQQAVLIPDYDHNRVIDATDRARARAGDVFYFWVNDDDDQGETSGTDIPGSKIPWTETTSSGSSNGKIHNYENDVVDGVRDLIDFFPVQFDLAKLLTVFPASRFNYRLTTGGDHLNLVFTKFSPKQAGSYLTGVPILGAQNDLTEAQILGHVPTHLVAAKGSSLFGFTGGMEFLKRLKTDGKNIVLFEGRKLLSGPLTLEISDGRGSPLRFDLNLSIAPVEQMFRHKNLIGQEAGYPPDSGSRWGEPDRLDEPGNCPDAVCLNTDGTDFVFVHGYNVDGQQARGWQSEIFKRLFWSGTRSRFWGVDWYGSDSQWFDAVTVNYKLNVQHAIKTASAFRRFLNKQMQGATSIAAHSLGNMLVAAALADQTPADPLTAPIVNFFMIDAAIATEAFTVGALPSALDSTNPMVHPDWYGYKPILAASEWYRLFANDMLGNEPDARGTLTWRNRFDGLRQLAINYYNFYSSGEDVLDVHYGEPSLIDATEGPGRYTWALQEKLKGRMPSNHVLSSRYGGWGFNWSAYSETVNVDAETTKKIIWLPDKANQIAEADLKTVPFFKTGTEFGSLFSSQGPGNSAVKWQRNKWLAEAFPALTGAAGGPEGRQLDGINFGTYKAFNMQTNFTNGWPQERLAKGDSSWKHSDLREVSHLYINTKGNPPALPGDNQSLTVPGVI